MDYNIALSERLIPKSMRSLWNDQEAAGYQDDLAQRNEIAALRRN
jgi:hypothetical protein